jgi:hypothetical protein
MKGILRRASLSLAFGIPAWFGFLVLVLVAVGGESSPVGGLVVMLLFVSWIILGFGDLTANLTLKLRLQERLPRVLEEYDVGTLLVSWNSWRLLHAAQDGRVLDDPSTGSLARVVTGFAVGTIGPFVVLLVVGIAVAAVTSVLQRNLTLLFLVLFLAAASLSSVLWSFSTGPDE